MRAPLLPYLAILATAGLFINLIGAGGTLQGQNLTAMALFVGLMAAEAVKQTGMANSLTAPIASPQTKTE